MPAPHNPSAGSGASADLSGLASMLDALGGLCDLVGPGSAGTFADDLAGIAADGMKARADRQLAPDGSTWDENRGAYGKAKRAKGIPVGRGLEESTYRMLAKEELLGDVEVTADRAIMTPARVYDKVAFFSEGNSRTGQPPRELVGLDAETVEKLADRVDRQIEGGIRRLGG